MLNTWWKKERWGQRLICFPYPIGFLPSKVNIVTSLDTHCHFPPLRFSHSEPRAKLCSYCPPYMLHISSPFINFHAVKISLNSHSIISLHISAGKSMTGQILHRMDGFGFSLAPSDFSRNCQARVDRAVASGHASTGKPSLNSEYHPTSLHVDPEKPQSLRLVVVPLATVMQGLAFHLILWGCKR